MELMKLHADREKVFQEITAIVQKGKITTEGAVSYTHLDVYKRQELWKDAGNCFNRAGFFAGNAFGGRLCV